MNTLAIVLAVSAESLVLALGHLSTGLNYYRDGKQEQALREFSIVLTDYRDTPAADDALYWSAMAYEARGDKEKAAAALAELARRFPNSPYVGATSATVAPAKPAASVPLPAPSQVATEPAKPAPSPFAAAPTPAANTPMLVGIRHRNERTVIEFNGLSFRTSADFEAALVEFRRSRPNLTVLLRQDPGVDLQMVIDAMNIFEKLQVNVRAQ